MNKRANPKIHNVRFYKPKVNAIYCMALQSQNNQLAISRSDASIEIWNIKDTQFIERTIASSTENYSIEGLAWSDSRLFSVGLHGLLIEYDLFKLDVKSRVMVTGEAAFCLDINREKSHIAIGTELGFLNIFQITDEEILFEKFLDKQDGRILCLKFDHTGEFIVSGGLDAIRVWSVYTNQALHKLITGRSESKKPTIVWSIAVTKDFTILSGDSRGILTVWDGKIGAQLESYQSHRADILSLTLSQDESSLYCAGVDPNIVNYVLVQVKDGARKWVRSIQRKLHEHDVRVLVLNDNKLYSGGLDGYLGYSYNPPKTHLKFAPVLQNPCISTATQARLILMRYGDYVEVWSLGESVSNKDKHSKLFVLSKKPKKIVVICKSTRTEEGEDKKEGIMSATISHDGKFIFYSTRLGSRLLKLDFEGIKARLFPIEMTENLNELPCVNSTFSVSNRLIIAPNAGGLKVLELSNDRPIVIQNINKLDYHDTIMLLSVTKDGRFLITGDVLSNIVVWIFMNNEYSFYHKLPKYDLCPTAFGVHPAGFEFVIAYSNGTIVEFDLNRKKLTKFSRALSKYYSNNPTAGSSVIRNITFDPRNENVILAHDDDSVIVIDKEKVNHESLRSPKSAKKLNSSFAKDSNIVRSISKQKHLVHLSWLSNDEMVAVEVNPLGLIEQLRPCIIQSTFGRK